MQKDFQEELFHYVQSRMDGSNAMDQYCYTKPSKKYILGALAAKLEKRKDEATDDPFKISENEKGSIRARQMRVSILIDKKSLISNPSFEVMIYGSVYYRINNNSPSFTPHDFDEGDNEEAEKTVWKRLDFSIPCQLSPINASEKLELNYEIDFSSIRNTINKDSEIFSPIPVSVWKAKLSINTTEYSDESCILHFFLTNNDTIPENKVDSFERTLFNCKLKINLGKLKNKLFCDKYMYSDFLQKYNYDFRTINCQASWVDIESGIFTTENFASYIQPDIVPKSSIQGVDLSFSKLASIDGITELEKILLQLKDVQEKYNEFYNNNNEQIIISGHREHTIQEKNEYIKQFEKVVELYQRGLLALKSNDNAMKSFTLMNKSFQDYYENKNYNSIDKGGRPSWRLFQIFFIVVCLRSLINQEDLDKVDVLHVATGGGKSEAYFGLIVFALFLERLNGKMGGVTAIVKFPLRMLSIQQLERLSSVIIYADKTKKQNEELCPGDGFSLGYYVGNADEDFPDLYSKLKRKLYDNSDFTSTITPAPISKIISKCPLCEASDRGNVRLVDDIPKQRIIHVCDKNPNHKFFIFLSDREIFRNRPSVIVSTVDKWAGLSQQRRARTLLGSKGSQCPRGHGFIPSGDKCEDNTNEEKLGNFKCDEIGLAHQDGWGPILSIQDELHLLREGFGTISSHFEGLIEQIIVNNSNGRKLKHVAMSATLNGVSDQIKEVYNKETIIIPGPSPEELEGKTGFFFERKEGRKRIIYGLKPNLRDSHYASLRSLLHSVEFLQVEQQKFMDDKNKFINEYGLANEIEALQIFKNHITPLTYHLKKQDAEDMHRLSDTVINDSLEKSYQCKVIGTVLTGDCGLDELKETIDNVREKVKQYDTLKQLSPGSYFNPIFSTSVVSHGVDLEELNLMIFQGMPHTTSEYIQALSRVGRKYDGMVIVWFYPNRVRDDSFFRNFQRYHESLDHEVRPVPVNRKSRLGMLQTVNSIFCATIIQYMSEMANKPLIRKEDVKKFSVSQNQRIVNFIKNVYGVPISINIETEVELRLRQISLSNTKDSEFFPKILTQSGNYFYRNQTGMRGIQKQLALELNPREELIIKKLRGD